LAGISVGSNVAAVGLDIGTDHIRLAQVKPVGGTFALTAYASVGVPMGAVVEGEIVDVEAVAMAIKDLLRTSGVRPKTVAIGVSNQKVVVRLIDLPYMERAELEGAIQYQAQDYIPIPIEDAILDFQIIGDYMTSADEHMMEVLLVAAQRDMIANSVQAVESAGLKLTEIDVTSFAIVRALMGVTPSALPSDADEADEAVGIIHISSGITNIAVVEKGVPRFTRVSSLAGNEFTQSIANALNLTFDEAEDLKIRVGLPDVEQHGPTDNPPDLDPARAQAAQDALEREVSKFIAEVRRSLDYYLTQATQVRTIRKIMLTGSGAQLRNIAGYLEKGLQATVTLSDPLTWMQVAPHLQAAVQADRMGSVAAIGLALGSVAP
jgi:type IV pilus assembly protein PilM